MYSTRAFRAATSMGSAGVVVLRVATSGTIQPRAETAGRFGRFFCRLTTYGSEVHRFLLRRHPRAVLSWQPSTTLRRPPRWIPAVGG